jgi:lysozyme family protein
MDAFETALALMLRDEGGFTKDPDDAGNWTGGQVGQGDLKGTNFGISAASYPELDIEGLTRDQAAAIYRSDWWDRYGFGQLPGAFGGKAFDIAVNVGAKTAIRLLQTACNTLGAALVPDGMIGPDTVAAVTRATDYVLWPAYVAQIETHYRAIASANPRDLKYLAGWIRRADETMQDFQA